MPNTQLIERLDYNIPMTLPILTIQNGTSFGIGWTINQILNTNSYNVIITTVDNAIPGTIFIYSNNQIISIIELSISDLANVNSVASKIAGSFLAQSWSISVINNTLTFVCTSSYISSPPDYIVKIKKDSDYIMSNPEEQDSLILDQIRSQNDYVNLIDPINFLHSLLNNTFYRNLTYTIQQEWQNVIDYINSLKTIYDIDYFDGDSASFNDKINNIFSLFGYNAPLFFTPYTNVENGDIPDITKQYDFLRNIVKRIWLQRRWAGTLNGYSLLCKFLNRLGAVHIAVEYNINGISPFTNKIYRLLNLSQLEYILPVGSNSYYPNSVNILGASNFKQIHSKYYKWDTGLTWSETPGIVVDAGITNVVFSPVRQVNNSFTVVVSSVAGADIGIISINGIEITLTDVNSVESVAAQIAAVSISGFNIIYDNGDSIIYSASPAPLHWDSPIELGIAKKSLMIEIGLDRLLYHSNSAGSKICLLDNVFLDAINYMLPNVKKGSDIVYVGSQLTMLTGGDGTFNSISEQEYTHPNIHAKFQVFKYKPDKITSSWTSGDAVSYIKIGSGGYGNSNIDQNVFVDRTENPNDPSKIILTDLQNPIFQTSIGVNEKDQYGGYYLINTVLHPRMISELNTTNLFLINGISTTQSENLKNTYLQLADKYIMEGSVSIGIDFDNRVPSMNFIPGSTSITLVSDITLISSSSFEFTIATGTGSGDSGKTIIVGGSTLTVSANRSASEVASDIASTFASNSVGWSATVSGAKVIMNYYLPEIHQRILVYEQYNPVDSVYDSTFKYQEIDPTTQNYVDFSDQALLEGYCTDPTYSLPSYGYFPTVQKRVLNLLPLTILDKYPTLQNGLIANYTFDEGNASSFIDYSINHSTAILNGNNGIGHNTTLITNNVVVGYAYGFNGTSSYGSVSHSTSIDNLISNSIIVFYNSLGEEQTSSTLVTKEASDNSSGWGLYYTCNGNTVTLTYKVNQLYSSLSWQATKTYSNSAPLSEYHQAVVSFDNINIPSISIDGEILPIIQISPTFSSSMSSTGVTISSAIQTNARTFVFNVTQGCSSSGSITIADQTVSVVAEDTPETIAIKIAATINNYWSASVSKNQVILQFSNSPVSETNTLCIGGSPYFGYFKGNLDEISIYNRALTQTEVLNSYTAIPQKNEPLLSSTGNQLYTYIDHKNGQIVIKPQFNVIGPMANFEGALSDYSNNNMVVSESYRISVANKNVVITEMGLFGADDSLLAYATFPPIIYNPIQYHLAFNLLIGLR